MSELDHQKWLDDLHVGDEVAVDIGQYGGTYYEIYKIDRITPSRRFSLKGKSAEFDSSGLERGKKDKWSTRLHIEPVTQKIKDHIRKRYIVARLDNAKWVSLDLPRLEELLKVLDSETNE